MQFVYKKNSQCLKSHDDHDPVVKQINFMINRTHFNYLPLYKFKPFSFLHRLHVIYLRIIGTL